MNLVVIGIGDMAVSNRDQDILVTYALASCVALTAYSPRRRVAGMIHIALPHPTCSDQVRTRPLYYATTGIPLLFEEMCVTHKCLLSELRIGLFGGAESLNVNDVFTIGKRNIQACADVLANMNLKAHISDLGGTNSRSLQLNVHSGEVLVTIQPLII